MMHVVDTMRVELVAYHMRNVLKRVFGGDSSPMN